MESFKKFDEIMKMDDRHQELGMITGSLIDIEILHKAVGSIEVNESVPDSIKGQFNVLRNLSLYTYFCYSLAPEVHMKSYSVMEMALRAFYSNDEKTHLKALVRKEVDSKVITDSGFRHVPDDPENPYSKQFVDIFPKLRNNSAHGTAMLVPHFIGHVERCADFVNQLYPCGAGRALVSSLKCNIMGYRS